MMITTTTAQPPQPLDHYDGDQIAHILHLPDGLTRESPNVIYCGRHNWRHKLNGSIYANPFPIKWPVTRMMSIREYAEWLPMQPRIIAALRALPLDRPFVFACWCAWPDTATPCHCRVLVALRQQWREEGGVQA